MMSGENENTVDMSKDAASDEQMQPEVQTTAEEASDNLAKDSGAADVASADGKAIDGEGQDTEESEASLDPLEAALAERDALKDQTLRALADVENMRRRTERELQNARKYGHLSFARDLLTSIDNLSQAVAMAPEDRDGLDDGLKNLLIGVEMIHSEIRATLERHHITQINPEGEKFDYNLHQAMFEVPTNEVEPGQVVQVAQPGYQLHDRLLRPAMVGVSKAADTDD